MHYIAMYIGIQSSSFPIHFTKFKYESQQNNHFRKSITRSVRKQNHIRSEEQFKIFKENFKFINLLWAQ